MKQNGNNEKQGNWYLGLDVGTSSCGWAVTDQDYNILKFKGKSMWGARLFDEANTAEARRTARTNRRRLNRRKQRLLLLESIFTDEIKKLDPNFFVRLHESNLWAEDRTESGCKYTLFNDPGFTDVDYLKKYPTIYHLRSELIHNDQPHDVRLVFLALHHIIKSRGHFLWESSANSEGKTLDEAMEDLETRFESDGLSFSPRDPALFKDVLSSADSVSIKKEKLNKAFGDLAKTEEDSLDYGAFLDLLSGATVKLSKLFCDDSLTDADIKSISLKDDIDSQMDQLTILLSDRADYIFYAKEVFDIAKLAEILGTNEYLSDAKIVLFKKNERELKVLKNFVRNNLSAEDYKAIFHSGKGNNLCAYLASDDAEKKCSQEEFCKYLEPFVAGMKDSVDDEEENVYKEIAGRTFLTKLKGSSNGVVPYQLQRKELIAILNNAEHYLPFLNDVDSDGYRTSDKIISLVEFRIPYYVGPLKNGWAVRKNSNERVYPWNFEKMIDEEASAEKFMENLVGRCTYTGAPALPLNSLLYSRYMVLNAINPIKVNGYPIDVRTKQQIFNDLFVKSRKKVTKKSIHGYLLSKGLIKQTDEISGIDDEINASLKSLHDFSSMRDHISDADIEKIIKAILVYGKDKKMLGSWIKKNVKCVTKDDLRCIRSFQYSEWGRLSKEFLTEIYHTDENGEVKTIMDMLWETNNTLMQLLSDRYQFLVNAQEYRKEQFGVGDSVREQVEDLYIAPAVKRSIWQTLKVVDELVDIQKSAPAKIMIEMARTNSKELKKKRTVSRKDTLSELYRSCAKEAFQFIPKEKFEKVKSRLEKETDQSLRRDKLFLYYTQLGCSAYTGEPIDFEQMMLEDKTYDIDHIFPRSLIKDNSLNNRVLVESRLNREKTNEYPIKDSIRKKMLSFWKMLHDKNLISDVKFERLNRCTPLTEEELSSFVARQIVETQQSTKALAEILHNSYPTSRIVYSKAGNVSDFRQEFDLPKFREINDLHHAKDAYLNIVVGNVYNTKFTDQFFKNITHEKYSLNKVFDFDVPKAWKADGTSIRTVKKYMAKNNPIVTVAQIEGKGMFFKLNPLSKGKGQLPIKEGMDINKYGGYDKVSGAYFCVVEHQKGKKRIRTIQPVLLYAKDEYENKPEEYCENVLNLEKPRIIVKKVPKNAILELDGSRLLITGRTGSQNVYRHAYEFSVDNEHGQYLKNLQKYCQRCATAGKDVELKVTSCDGISAEDNVKMYDWFISRIEQPCYLKLFNNERKQLSNCRDAFCSLSILKQAKALMEILKVFKCDSVFGNFKEFNGSSGTAGRVQKSSNISSFTSAFLIHQSSTGLYETKVDLLK